MVQSGEFVFSLFVSVTRINVKKTTNQPQRLGHNTNRPQGLRHTNRPQGNFDGTKRRIHLRFVCCSYQNKVYRAFWNCYLRLFNMRRNASTMGKDCSNITCYVAISNHPKYKLFKIKNYEDNFCLIWESRNSNGRELNLTIQRTVMCIYTIYYKFKNLACFP